MLTWLRSVFFKSHRIDPFAAPFGDLPKLPAGSLLDQDNHSVGRAASADRSSGGDGKTYRAPSLPVIRGRGHRAF